MSILELSDEPAFQRVCVCQFALPDRDDNKTLLSQEDSLAGVSDSVRLELRAPKSSIGFGYRGEPAAGVAMPEATVDEYRPFGRLIYNVWGPWKSAHARPEPKSQAPKYFANDPFGRGIALTHLFHPGRDFDRRGASHRARLYRILVPRDRNAFPAVS